MRLIYLLAVAVLGSFFSGCGEDAVPIQENSLGDSVLKLISESGTDVRAGKISSQMSKIARGISDERGKRAFLRSCEDAIRRRLSKTTRTRGYLVGSEPNFWLAVGCCDEMRKAGFSVRECLSLPFEVIQAVCREIELTESGAMLDGAEWSSSRKERDAHVRGLSSSVKQWTVMLERYVLNGRCWAMSEQERQIFLEQIKGFEKIAERNFLRATNRKM